MHRAGHGELPFADAMTWPPQTIRPEASLEEAVCSLSEHRIGCLPVVDADLVGMISETDALRALLAALQGAAGPGSPRVDELQGVVAELWRERRELVRQLEQWQDAERMLSADLQEEPRDSANRAIDERDVGRVEPVSARGSQRRCAPSRERSRA